MSHPTIILLPPLNSHHNHTIRVVAHQLSFPPSSTPPPTHDHAESTLSIKVKINVDFFSSNPRIQRTLKGLSVRKSFNLPSDTVDIDVVSDLIAQTRIPFPLDEIQWESQRIDRVCSATFLDNEDDLVKTFSDFLRDLVSAPCNENRKELGVSLSIKKSVTMPADEFEALTARYDEQERMREQCSICLEELEVGGRVARLPCAHQFHRECVKEWLERSNASCPLCRHPLTEDHSLSILFSVSLGFELPGGWFEQ